MIFNKSIHPTDCLGARATALAAALVVSATAPILASAADPGVLNDRIVIGGVMDQEGSLSGISAGLQRGIRAALDGKEVQGRRVELVVLNDGYEPDRAVEASRELIERGIFAMVGNVGTPTAQATLPVLAESNVPAVGFFTGAGLLRPGVGDVVNYRASYTDEVAATVTTALDAGVAPAEVCAFLQNDAYGMSAVAGMKVALSGRDGAEPVGVALDSVAAMPGVNPERNFLGPVGVYTRNTFSVFDAYASLKAWEEANGVRCKLVVTAAANRAVATFAGYSRQRGETWVVSAVSFTGADTTAGFLRRFGVRDGVLMTQVVPDLEANIPVVNEARQRLGANFNYVSLEGFLVGRTLLVGLQAIEGDLTRQAFLNGIYGRQLDIGGMSLDYGSDNQGSDAVAFTTFEGAAGFVPTNQEQLRVLLGS